MPKIKSDKYQTEKVFLFKCIFVWGLFNFLVLMFKVNDLDHDRNPAWNLIKWVWYTDIFILWVIAIATVVALILVIYFVLDVMLLNKRNTHLQADLSQSSKPLEKKVLTEILRQKEEPAPEPQTVIPEVKVVNEIKPKPKVKTKQDLRKDLLNNFMGRDL